MMGGVEIGGFGTMPGLSLGIDVPGLGDDVGYWGGGHEYSQSAVMFGFREILLPDVTVRLQKQGLHGEELTARAYTEAIRIFNIRFSENIAYLKRERQREPEMITEWEIIENPDGTKEMHHREYDITLRQLLENTERYAHHVRRPDLYNKEEAQALLQIQDALVSGEGTAAAYFVSHPNGVRYAQHVERRGDIIVSTQVDVGQIVGRDLFSQEATAVIQRISAKHRADVVITDASSQYPHLIFRDGALDAKEIKTVALAHVLVSETQERRPHIPQISYEGEIHNEDTETKLRREDEGTERIGQQQQSYVSPAIESFAQTVEDLGQSVLDNTRDTVVLSGKFLVSRVDKKKPREKKIYQSEKASLLERFRSFFLVNEEGKPFPLSTEGFQQTQFNPTVSLVKSRVQTKTQREASQQQSLASPELWQKILGIKRGIVFKTETRAGISIALLGLRAMAQELPGAPRAVKQKNLLNQETGPSRVRREESRNYRREKRKRRIKELQAGKQRERKAKLRIEQRIQPAPDFFKRRKEKKIKETTPTTKKKKKTAGARIEQLWKTLGLLTKLLERPRINVGEERKTLRKKTRRGAEVINKTKKDHEKRVALERRQRQDAVLRFSFAWLLWYIISQEKHVVLPRNISIYRESNAGRKSDKKDAAVSKKAVSEPGTLVRQEGTLWILLSIVWCLAMVREGGGKRVHSTQYKGLRKIKQKNPAFTPRGVIFAFNS